MTRRRHDDRADALDRWLDAWQRGEEPVVSFDESPSDADPVGDELATAQALASYGDRVDAPREPLVALRAALAARRALREPAWRRRLLTGTRLAPLAAAAAVVAVVAVGAVTSPEPSTPDDAVALARQSLAGVSDQVEFVQARGAVLDSDPATIHALLEADRNLSKASAAAELADGATRRLLESQIRELQELVDRFKRQIVVLNTTVPPTSDPPVVATSSTTTTSTAPTTTTRPQPTTTTRPAPTTTTRPAPTTTTTDAPIESTSTTRNEPGPSTTTAGPGTRSTTGF